MNVRNLRREHDELRTRLDNLLFEYAKAPKARKDELDEEIVQVDEQLSCVLEAMKLRSIA